MPQKSRIETSNSRLRPGQSLREISQISDKLVGQDSEDLRIDKVMELRTAIKTGSYDLDQRVDDLLGKLETNLSGLVQAEADAQPPGDTDTLDQADPLDDAKSLEEPDAFDNDDFQDEFESLDALNENEDIADKDDFDKDDFDEDDFDDEDDQY